jgi:hypothetical protein
MNSQAGIHSRRKAPARIPPAAKLIQAKQARIMRTEPLQNNSNVLMRTIYNKNAEAKMGFLPYPKEG